MLITQNLLFANRYLLTKKLGVGGYSEVWLAEDNKSAKTLALKIFAPDKGLDPQGLKMFAREYALILDLNHPNLLKPLHFDDWNDMPYLVMQYMPNGSCFSKIGQITEAELARLLHQMGSALHYLHGRPNPIIHQDIKPDNILIDQDGNYLLADFGISTNMRRTFTRSAGRKGNSSGTLPYMPPERYSQNLDAQEAAPAHDIFSLGVTLFELLTARLPYGEQGGMAVYSNISHAQLPDAFSAGLRELIHACLQPAPTQRPTAAQLVQAAKKYEETGIWDLKGLSNSRGLSGVEGPPPSPPKK